MMRILLESAWWLLVTEINVAAWFVLACLVLVHWVLFDALRRLL